MQTLPEAPQDNLATPTSPATPDDPKLSARDWFRCATVVLIALNVLIFLVMVIRGASIFSPTTNSVLKWGADYGPLTLHGEWWRMLVSTFLHFGIIHLLFNMFVLFNIGLFMESVAGRLSSFGLYLACGPWGSSAILPSSPPLLSP